jgi:hypothetical protein
VCSCQQDSMSADKKISPRGDFAGDLWVPPMGEADMGWENGKEAGIWGLAHGFAPGAEIPFG